MPGIQVLSVAFSPVTEEEAASLLALRAPGPSPLLVFTPNPLMVMEARKDGAFRDILNGADISLADGRGIVDAARRQGTPLPCRATGIGTAEKAFALLAQRRGGVYLLGGKPGVAEQTASRLTAAYPGLRVTGFRDGYFSPEEIPDVVSSINAAAPDLLCVCLGSPAQERFLHGQKERLCAGSAMGLGGALDVWSGRLKRAPALWRKLGLEWLWRMFREPRRFRRLPVLVRFRWLTRRRLFR